MAPANKKAFLILSVVILSLGAAVRAADAPVDAVSIGGAVAKAQSWTPEALKTDFAHDMKSIQYTSKGTAHGAQAVPLMALINAAVPQLDSKTKNDELRMVVIVEGKDGYLATFTLAELMPTIGNREAWLTLDADGKPLTDRDGPVSLVVPGDQKPERWVHGVKGIRIVDISAGH